MGNDNNTVQILTYPDLEKEGIVTRFSAPVSALATAKDSNLIVSGAWYVNFVFITCIYFLYADNSL